MSARRADQGLRAVRAVWTFAAVGATGVATRTPCSARTRSYSRRVRRSPSTAYAAATSLKRAAAAASRSRVRMGTLGLLAKGTRHRVGVGRRIDSEQRVVVDRRPVTDARATPHAGTLPAAELDRSVVLQRDGVGRHVHRRLVLRPVHDPTLAAVLHTELVGARRARPEERHRPPRRHTAGTASARAGTASGRSGWLGARSTSGILARPSRARGAIPAPTSAPPRRGSPAPRRASLDTADGSGVSARRLRMSMIATYTDSAMPIAKPTIAPAPRRSVPTWSERNCGRRAQVCDTRAATASARSRVVSGARSSHKLGSVTSTSMTCHCSPIETMSMRAYRRRRRQHAAHAGCELDETRARLDRVRCVPPHSSCTR